MDKLYAGFRGLLQLCRHIICAESDVMNAARRILLEEFCDRAFRIGRFEQFKVNFSQ